MSSSSTATPDEQTLYAALELSKNSWLLAIQFPDRDNPSLHPIKGSIERVFVGGGRREPCHRISLLLIAVKSIEGA